VTRDGVLEAVDRAPQHVAALEAQWGYRLNLEGPGERVRLEPGEPPRNVDTVSICGADGQWRRVHSARAPEQEARAQLAGVLPGATAVALPPLVCVIGAGLGWIVDVVEAASDTTRVLVLEPEPALARAMLLRRDWRPLIAAGRLMVLTGPAFDGAAEAWRLAGDGAVEPLVFAHPVITAARPTEAVLAARVVKRLVSDARANADARRRFEGRYLINTLRNLEPALNAPDVAALDGRFAGLPAIVCGAGPSLDETIAALQRIESLETRAVLICADTAIRPLSAAGLRRILPPPSIPRP
jgi:hypothetical protein